MRSQEALQHEKHLGFLDTLAVQVRVPEALQDTVWALGISLRFVFTPASKAWSPIRTNLAGQVRRGAHATHSCLTVHENALHLMT